MYATLRSVPRVANRTILARVQDFRLLTIYLRLFVTTELYLLLPVKMIAVIQRIRALHNCQSLIADYGFS
jgi:hypothetical protein